jgi:hypothetical protein
VSRLLVAQRALTVPGWAKDALWRRAQAIPSLDLRFAENKSLVDATTGSNLVTFTRASSGTFVGSDGVLRTAVTNLLLRSEEFDNASWTKVRSSITANAIVAPNGTLTADKLVENTDNNTHVIEQAATLPDNVNVIYGFYVKKAERSIARIQFLNKANTACRAYFNVDTGVVSDQSNATGSIVNVGDGWYQCSISFSSGSGATATSGLIGPAVVAGTASYTGDGTSGIYLWGAQLEQSSTVGEYIPTTSTINSAPRFDHNPTTGESLGLLVEEQRTNLLLQSQDFATTWGGANITIASNSTTAPDGTTTADTLTHVTASSERVQTSQSFTAGSAVTASIFAKKNTSNFFRFELGNVVSCWFNLNTGTVASNQAGSGNVLFSAKSIQAFPNGWYRCILTCTTSTITTLSVKLFATNADGNSSAIDSSVYLWGADLQAGSTPTSYIPTTTTAVTRSADLASIGSTAFSGFYNQSEGTLFASGARYGTADGRFAGFDSGSINDTYVITASAARNAIVSSVSGGGFGGGVTTSNSFAYLASIKVAATLSSLGDETLCLNGGAVASGATTTPSASLTTMRIGTQAGATTGFYNGTIQRLTYWRAQLPSSTLQAITG